MNWLTLLIAVASVVELALAAAGYVAAGAMGCVAALAGASIATAAQLTAILVLRPGLKAPGPEFMKRWAGGIMMRGLSFVIVAALIVLTKNVMPPLWLAAGWLVQMLTLLFAETVFLK